MKITKTSPTYGAVSKCRHFMHDDTAIVPLVTDTADQNIKKSYSCLKKTGIIKMNVSVSWNEQKAKIETNCTKLFGTEGWSKGRRKDEQRHRDTHLGGCGAGAGVGATAGAGGTTRLGLAISSPAPKMKCIYVNLTSHPPNLSLVKSELGLRWWSWYLLDVFLFKPCNVERNNMEM